MDAISSSKMKEGATTNDRSAPIIEAGVSSNQCVNIAERIISLFPAAHRSPESDARSSRARARSAHAAARRESLNQVRDGSCARGATKHA